MIWEPPFHYRNNKNFSTNAQPLFDYYLPKIENIIRRNNLQTTVHERINKFFDETQPSIDERPFFIKLITRKKKRYYHFKIKSHKLVYLTRFNLLLISKIL